MRERKIGSTAKHRRARTGYGMRGWNTESAVTLVREVLLRKLNGYISRSFLAPARAFSQLSSTLSPQLSHQ